MRDTIKSGWCEIQRLRFIADAAAGFAAASVTGDETDWGDDGHAKMAAWAVDGAEALWAELCERFRDEPDSK